MNDSKVTDLKVGDVIVCANKEEMVEISEELAKLDILTDFDYSHADYELKVVKSFE